MVMVIEGDSTTYNALMYGVGNHPNTQQYMLQRCTDAYGSSNNVFMQAARNEYERYNGAAALHLARAALAKAGHLAVRNEIHAIDSYQGIQNAPLIMQRYIMAQPDIRQLYHQQRCDGYSDSYLDVSPGCIGIDHYDYRQVTDGLVMIDEKTGDEHIQFYPDHELAEGDRVLLVDEKADILHSWKVAMALLESGYDPTDAMNRKL